MLCLRPTTSPYHQHSLSSCPSARPPPSSSCPRPCQHYGIVPCPASPSSPDRLRCTMVLLILIASAIATQPSSLIPLSASPQHTHKARLTALPSHNTPTIASPQPHPMQLRSTPWPPQCPPQCSPHHHPPPPCPHSTQGSTPPTIRAPQGTPRHHTISCSTKHTHSVQRILCI